MIDDKGMLRMKVLLIFSFAIIMGLLVYVIIKPCNNNQVINEDIYTKYLTNLEQNIKTNYDDYNNNIVSSSSEVLNTTYTITITKDLDLMFKSTNEELNRLLDTNVLNMFLIEEGNGGFKYIYYIKNDGSLNMVCIDCYKETNEFKVEKVNKENIVNVTQGLFDSDSSGFRGPIFIDIHGNVLTN